MLKVKSRDYINNIYKECGQRIQNGNKMRNYESVHDYLEILEGFGYCLCIILSNIILLFEYNDNIFGPGIVFIIIYITNQMRQFMYNFVGLYYMISLFGYSVLNIIPKNTLYYEIIIEGFIMILYVILCGFNLFSILLFGLIYVILLYLIFYTKSHVNVPSLDDVYKNVFWDNYGINYWTSAMISFILSIPFMFYNDISYFNTKSYQICIIVFYMYDELSKIINVWSNIVRYIYGLIFIIVNVCYMTIIGTQNWFEFIYSCFTCFIIWVLWCISMFVLLDRFCEHTKID